MSKENFMTTTLTKICNRLPIELVPLKQTESAVLSAITKLKTERNNALHYERLIYEHNKECKDLCDRDRCGYAQYQRRCPECPLNNLIELD